MRVALWLAVTALGALTGCTDHRSVPITPQRTSPVLAPPVKAMMVTPPVKVKEVMVTPPAPKETSLSLKLKPQRDEYHLSAGDQVRIIVFENTDLSGEFDVDMQGYIAFPLLGEIDAQDKTVTEIAQAINQGLKDRGFVKDASVNVSIIAYRPFFILGEVRRPGSFPYQSGMNVYKAVALAGGFTYRAVEDKALITRDKESRALEAPMTAPVNPGDTVLIKERFF